MDAKLLQQKFDSLEKELAELKKEIEEEIPEDTVYPWSEHIKGFIDLDPMPETFSSEELEEFAKKEALSKSQLRQLQSLHGDLNQAKERLELHFKKPPVTRSEIEEEISAIQDAMAELLRTAKVKRILVDPFVYALRKVRTHFTMISENKAIESLKKKKLSRFIKKVEVIDMGGLREYLIKSKVNIPGLRKIEDDVSIYIYEKHEEGYELVKFEDAENYSKDNFAGIYLVQPHSELIWTGAKTAVVKSKKFDKNINVPLYLISDKKCYGVIELSTPVEINKKEFEERYNEHLVEDFERVEWWDEKFPLYLYEVKVIEKFEPVREVDIPAGIQVWVLPDSIKFK